MLIAVNIINIMQQNRQEGWFLFKNHFDDKYNHPKVKRYAIILNSVVKGVFCQNDAKADLL